MKNKLNRIMMAAVLGTASLLDVGTSRAGDLFVDNILVYSNAYFAGSISIPWGTPIDGAPRFSGNVWMDYNLSIGRSNATAVYPLDVFGATADTVARFCSSSTNYSGVVLDATSSTADPVFTFKRQGVTKAFSGIQATDDSFYFTRADKNAAQLRISASGEMTTAGYEMYRGNNYDSGTFNLGVVTNYQGRIHYNAAGDTIFYFDNTWNSTEALTKFRMKTSGTPLDVLTMKGNGNVGVGTNAPAARLHVTGGNVKVDGGGQFVGNGSGLLISAQGDLSMGTFTAGQQP